jgi:hypothetical protein
VPVMTHILIKAGRNPGDNLLQSTHFTNEEIKVQRGEVH